QRSAAPATARPPEPANPLTVQANDWTVPFPAAGPSRVVERHVPPVQSQALDRQFGDLRDRDVVGGDVVHGEALSGAPRRQQDSFHDVTDVDVRLALRAVPEDTQPASVL